jgi:hypothetical protein
MEAKTIINKKGILSKMSNARGITIPGFKIYYKDIVKETACILS